jgi:hypothetical protein
MAKERWEDAVREFRRAKEIDGGNHEANDGLNRAEAALKQSKVKDYYKILGAWHELPSVVGCEELWFHRSASQRGRSRH